MGRAAGSRCRGKVGKGSRVGSAAGAAGVPRGVWWAGRQGRQGGQCGPGGVPGGAVDMVGMWAGAAWVSGRGLVGCGLMGPGAVGPSLVGPGPLGAAQNPGRAVDAGPGAGSDCDQKPKLPFCNDSKLPGRSGGQGVPKSLALPIRVYQATFPPGCLHCSRGARSAFAIKLPRRMVLHSYTHISSYPAALMQKSS